MYWKFNEVIINEVKPNGWLLNYLKNQKEGLTGHLEVAGWPFNMTDWSHLDEIYDNWWPYEQTGYWADGMIKCGYLLNDEEFICRAKGWIEHVLQNPDMDGYLGPKYIKKPENQNRWVHSVFFRAVMVYYDVTKDDEILKALTRHYLSDTSPHNELREVCNVEIMLWIYKYTKDDELLQCAEKAYKEYNKMYPEDECTLANMASDKKTFAHGVSFNEMSKLGAILYMYTGKTEYLYPVVNAYKKIDRDCMLADGVMSSSEFLAGKGALDSHETCNVSDFSWSMGYLFMATGDVEYADKIEKASFNAAPGSVTSDFKALQYFSCPNQVICDGSSNHNEYYKGTQKMSYRPNPGTSCCAGNVNRIMPNYISRMWMKDNEGNLSAVLYGASTITTTVGESKQPVTIEQTTDYPFDDTIIFKIITERSLKFKLRLRIPTWCEGAKVYINEQICDLKISHGMFFDIERIFDNNDTVMLLLPMELKTVKWENGGISIERGPLTYSLKIKEKWLKVDDDKLSTESFPAWSLYADSAWNYALCRKNILENATVIFNSIQENPWSIENAPVEIQLQASKVKGWDVERYSNIKYLDDSVKKTYADFEGDFVFTPDLPKLPLGKDKLGETESITLVPYGCTKLRITVFPYADM